MLLAQENVDDTFDRANELYAAEAYDEAMNLYSGLWSSGYQGSSLAYNMGNTFLRQGDIGRAILFYRRSLLI